MTIAIDSKPKLARVLEVATAGGDFQTVQAAVDAAMKPLLTTKAIAGDINTATGAVDGDYLTITVKNISDDAVVSSVIYEFDADASGTHVVEGSILVDNSMDDWGVALYNSIAANQGTYLYATTQFKGDCEITLKSDGYYIVVDVSHFVDSTWTATGYYQVDDGKQYIFLVYPGTYEENVTLYNNCHLVGVDRDACIISNPLVPYYKDTEHVHEPVVFLGRKNSSISNMTLLGDNTTDTVGVGYSDMGFTDGAHVYNCVLNQFSWAFCFGRYLIKHTSVQNCPDIVSANPWFTYGALQFCDVTNCNIHQLETRVGSSVCLALIDGGSMPEYFRIAWRNNIIDLEGYGTEYLAKLPGCGHIFENNTYRHVGDLDVGFRMSNTSPIATVPDGYLVEPNRITGNTFEWVLACGETKQSTNMPLFIASNVDVEFGRNTFIVDDTGSVATLKSIHAGGDSVVTIHSGGLDGLYKFAPETADTAVIIGYKLGSGAGLSAALLDAAFAGGASANRAKLAGWFDGIYTNTSDSSKKYKCWTDGTDWFYEAVATKL